MMSISNELDSKKLFQYFLEGMKSRSTDLSQASTILEKALASLAVESLEIVLFVDNDSSKYLEVTAFYVLAADSTKKSISLINLDDLPECDYKHYGGRDIYAKKCFVEAVKLYLHEVFDQVNLSITTKSFKIYEFSEDY